MPATPSGSLDNHWIAFKSRGQTSIYRSMLRSAVEKLDKVKPARSFRDKDEWKAVLSHLATTGVLTYVLRRDVRYNCPRSGRVTCTGPAF